MPDTQWADGTTNEVDRVMQVLFRSKQPLLAVICVGLILTSQIAAAQEAAPAPAPAAAPAAAVTAPMSIEQAQSKLAEVQSATQLEETAKSELTARWTEIADTLKAAANFATQADEFQARIDEAPQRIEELKQALAAPAAEPAVDGLAEADLSTLEQTLTTASAKLEESRKQLSELEAEPARRAARRKAIPEALAQARQRLDEVRTQIQSASADATPAAEAARALLAAKQWSLSQEIRAYETELRLYDVASPLITLQMDNTIRNIALQEKQVKHLQDLILKRRQTDAREAATAARQLRTRILQLPFLQEWAEFIRKENEAMAQQRTGPDGLIAKTDDVQEDVHAMEAQVDAVISDFTSVSERIDAVGLNNAVGMLLRKYLTDLPNLRVHRGNIRNRQETIANVQLSLIQSREERRAVADVDAEVANVLKWIPAQATDDERAVVEDVFRELLRTTRDNLDALLIDSNTYFEALQNLDAAERELVAETAKFYAYIDERVLWIASGSVFGWEDVKAAWDGLRWVSDPEQWRALARTLLRSLRQFALPYLLLCGLILLMILTQRRLRATLVDLGSKASKRSTVSIRPTIDAAVLTIFAAVPVPLVLCTAGWLVAATPSETDFSVGFGKGLQSAGFVLLLINFVRKIARKGGLGESHFGWPEAAVSGLRWHLTWLAAIVLPAIFLVQLVDSGDYKESLGRAVYVVMLGAIAAFIWIVFRPRYGAFQQIVENRRSKEYSKRFRAWWHIAFAALPVVLLAAAVAGYFYTSQRLVALFFLTAALNTGLLFIYGLILRWLMLTRRAMAMEQARKRLAALKARDSEGEQPEVPLEEVEVDLAKVDVQTQRLVRSVLVFAFLVGLWAIWADTLPALNILNRVELPWTRTAVVERTVMVEGAPVVQREDVEVPVTGVHVLGALLIALMTVVAARNVPGLLEIAVLQRLSIGAGERYAITTMTRYLLAVAGGVLTFQAIGIGWANVQWLVAAVGLGLGFGLQEIFGNFVSGLIILFERPIRAGDTVTVGGISGTVTRIRIRATTITDFDRKELVVPNKEFVTNQVINWTLTSTTLRIVIPIGIAYGSDTRRAEQILYELAQSHRDVMTDPAPEVWFTGLGDSTLHFELRVFSATLDSLLQIRHDLLMQIIDAFKKAGIEIAFPQRDIHLRSVNAVVAVSQQESNRGTSEPDIQVR